MGIVAFDANTCIWGIKEEFTPGQEQNINRAKALIALLGKHETDILIPNPVVSEILSPIPDQEARLRLFSEITKKFHVGLFDHKASLVLAEILSYHYNGTNKEYKNLGISKRCMKYDAYIIAIAVSQGAECVYSEDPDFKHIAGDFIAVKSLDGRPDSIIMVEDGEIDFDGEQ